VRACPSGTSSSLILRDENTDGDATCTDADDERLFYLADANYNVTAVVAKNPQSGQWHVAERYVYDPYGRVTVLNGDPAVDPDGQGDPSTYPEWSVDPGPDGQQGTSDDGTTSDFLGVAFKPSLGHGGVFSREPEFPVATFDFSNTTLYTGRELDLETGLYYYRRRMYHPTLGKFLWRDPLLYRAGDENLYRYVGNRPLGRVDPKGMYMAPPGVFVYKGGNFNDRYRPVRPIPGHGGTVAITGDHFLKGAHTAMLRRAVGEACDCFDKAKYLLENYTAAIDDYFAQAVTGGGYMRVPANRTKMLAMLAKDL